MSANIKQRKTEIQRSHEDFTFLANFLFKSLGYDLMDSPTTSPRWWILLQSGYFLLCIVSSLYEAAMLILRIIQWESLAGSPSTIMRYALHFFYMISAQGKFFTFMMYRKKLRILNNMLKDLYPSDEQKRKEYDVNSFYLSRSTRYCFYFYYLVMVLMEFGPAIQSCIVYYVFGKDFPYLRIFPTRLNFDSHTRLGYIGAYLLDLTCSHLIVNMSVAGDLWMMCMSSQISMHFAHLAKVLTSYRPSQEREQEDCYFLSILVKRHQLILRLHADVNNVFGILLASNLFTTASLLCCIAYYIVVQGVNLEGFSYLMVFVSVTGQFYMVSAHGQMLIDSSTSIAAAAYENKWYNGSVRYKKEILYIMTKSQRPAEISAKGIIIISLETFKILMSITYRVFAVLRQTVK
ncbi:odorant receptor 49a-like [Drosophila ficusphila]|uniref:odorant receptor 49a-like n=1 Tax=Drosophila ficusphila TaxID=30025 RepID=UPI0007E815B0|nr:odorant receptor 49a-like [Drosophila ficusphila]